MFSMGMPDRCGAFFHDVAAARLFIRKGHSVSMVYTVRSQGNALVGSYRDIPYKHYSYAEKELQAADVYTSPHYPIMAIVRKLNERYQKPLVITTHFAGQMMSLNPYEQTGKWAEAVMFVSNMMKQVVESTIPVMASSIKRTGVQYPIMIRQEVELHEEREKGEYITLVNGNMLKGVDVFLRIANDMPDYKFKGVRAYYSKTEVHNTQNVSWEDYTDDIRGILTKTRILLVPSVTESWSRIAFEAMYNGIPVIYTKPYESQMFAGGTTHAMTEWIQDSAIACDRTNIQEWIEAIRQLDDEEFYEEMSRRGKERTRELDMFSNGDRYEAFIASFIRDFPSRNVSTDSKQAPAQARAPMQPPQRLGFLAGRFGVRKR